MILDDTNRAAVWAEYMRENFGEVAVTKADLRAAVNALDQFLEDNRTNINSAIPQPARGALTTRQKIQMLMFVLRKRLEAGSD